MMLGSRLRKCEPLGVLCGFDTLLEEFSEVDEVGWHKNFGGSTIVIIDCD